MLHIAISGDIGSGKSSVARLLSQASGLQVVCAGDLQRAMAAAIGLTTLELNQLAERANTLDAFIDSMLTKLGHSETGIIFDSRMAWRLVPSALKVHLTVDSEVAAKRLLSGRTSPVESYRSIDEARRSVEARRQSEKRRFAANHGVDVSCLENYDLIVDTNHVPLASVVSSIQSEWGKHALRNVCAV